MTELMVWVMTSVRWMNFFSTNVKPNHGLLYNRTENSSDVAYPWAADVKYWAISEFLVTRLFQRTTIMCIHYLFFSHCLHFVLLKRNFYLRSQMSLLHRCPWPHRMFIIVVCHQAMRWCAALEHKPRDASFFIWFIVLFWPIVLPATSA